MLLREPGAGVAASAADSFRALLQLRVCGNMPWVIQFTVINCDSQNGGSKLLPAEVALRQATALALAIKSLNRRLLKTPVAAAPRLHKLTSAILPAMARKASSSVPEAGGGGGASGDDAFDAACYPPSLWCRT